MTANPFVALYEAPAETLLALAWTLALVGVLVLTWWALSRNLVWLDREFQDGWRYLVPLEYALRTMAVLGLLAVDCAVIAAIIRLFV